MENKQKNISLSYGIHRTPSLGKDGELSECVNLIPKNGELVNIARPEPVAGITLPEGAVLMCVHHISVIRQDNFVSYESDTGRLYWQIKGGPLHEFERLVTGIIKVLPFGNILVLFTEEGSLYFQWKDNSYKFYEEGLPNLSIRFGLSKLAYNQESLTNLYTLSTIAPRTEGGTTLYNITADSYFAGSRPSQHNAYRTRQYGVRDSEMLESFKNDFIGTRNKLIEQCKENGTFCLPFFVRYAIRYYDGSSALWSPPVLMVPGISPIFYIDYIEQNGTEGNNVRINCRVMSGILDYAVLEEDISRWEGIIKAVDIYVSPLIYVYESEKVNATYLIHPDDVAKSSGVRWLNIGSKQNYDISVGASDSSYDLREVDFWNDIPKFHRTVHESGLAGREYGQFPLIIQPNVKELENITKDVTEESNFYKIATIPLSDLSRSRRPVPIESGLLQVLEQQERGSYRASSISGYKNKNGIMYNGRIWYFNIEEKASVITLNPAILLPYTDELQGGTSASVNLRVEYNSQKINGVYGIGGNDDSIICPVSNNQKPPFVWLFIPSNANITQLFASYNIESNTPSNNKYGINLTEHNYLGGYYWFNLFKSPEDTVSEVPGYSPSEYYSAANKVLISGVYNPFNIKDTDSLELDVSSISALCPITRALSQGQFGDFAVYAFTSEGIWAININSEGSLDRVNPVSRDVAVNANAIIQTDNGIVFPTAQGLKFITGSDIRLLSSPVEGFNPNDLDFRLPEGHPLEEFNGLLTRDNNDFVQMIQDSNTRILYDYAQQLIHIFTGEEKHYCYSLESGEWAQQRFEVSNYFMPTAIVPTYPLSVMQFGQHLYEYTGVKNSAPFPELPTLRPGIAITRPIALEDPTTMTALMDLRLIGQRTRDGIIRRIALYGSRDGYRWHPVRSLKHGSFKYYRFVIYSSMTDYDTLSGISVIYQPRRNHKLR